MTKVLFSFWWLIFLTWLFQYIDIPFLNPIDIKFLKEYSFEWIISTQYMFTTLWAIFAFWYWYKRYERDKEINTIKHYSEKYDLIRDNFQKGKIGEKKYYSKIWNLWKEEFLQYKRWYITKAYFNEIWSSITTFIVKEILKNNDWEILRNIPLGNNSFNIFICSCIDCAVNQLRIMQKKIKDKKGYEKMGESINSLNERKKIFN